MINYTYNFIGLMREARLSRVARKRERGCRRSINSSVQAGKRVLGCGRICRRLSRKWSAVIGQERDRVVRSHHRMHDRAFSILPGSAFFI